MSLNRFSAGPWIAENVDGDPFNFYVYSPSADCVVVKLDRREDASIKYADRTAADAALIATAPMMLAALRLAEEFIGNNPKNDPGDGTLGCIRFAIAKASATVES